MSLTQFPNQLPVPVILFLFSGRMAGLARTPGALPSVRHPVLHVLRALGHILELPHGATPAGEAMERAQGVSSGPRGPESMVMVCFIASFVKRDTIPIPKATISPKKKEREKKEATAGCLSHCKSSMLVLPLGLFTDL